MADLLPLLLIALLTAIGLGLLPKGRSHLSTLWAGLVMMVFGSPSTTADYAALLLLIAPLGLAVGAIALVSGSLYPVILWALPLVGAGAVAGGLLMVISATAWLQVLAPKALDSQGGGIAYIAIFVPLFAYSGWAAGAFLVAAGLGWGTQYPATALFGAIATLGTLIIGGLGLTLLLRFLEGTATLNHSPTGNPVIQLGLVALGNATLSVLVSSAIAHCLTQWTVTGLTQLKRVL
ncbi:MAG: hypothetical protein Fur0046_07590 [Cyanobacteria bacterium J069]|nr:MAG: hypothetical protein D6742_19440 [Cyanobacteria bacterium J069]